MMRHVTTFARRRQGRGTGKDGRAEDGGNGEDGSDAAQGRDVRRKMAGARPKTGAAAPTAGRHLETGTAGDEYGGTGSP